MKIYVASRGETNTIQRSFRNFVLQDLMCMTFVTHH